MEVISGKAACEFVATGAGVVTGAIGTSGNPLGILIGGAAGYFLGTIVCKIPALQRAFDRAVNGGDISQLQSAVSSREIGTQAVAILENDGGLSKARAEAVWSAIVSAVKANGKGVTKDKNVASAKHHPPTGHAAHGISNLTRQSVA